MQIFNKFIFMKNNYTIRASLFYYYINIIHKHDLHKKYDFILAE